MVNAGSRPRKAHSRVVLYLDVELEVVWELYKKESHFRTSPRWFQQPFYSGLWSSYTGLFVGNSIFQLFCPSFVVLVPQILLR